MLDREIYIPTPGPRVSTWVFAGYLDGRGTRHERLITSGDDGQRLSERISKDNGRTWTEFTPIEGLEQQLPTGGIRIIPGLYFYDPHLDMLYQAMMRRVWPNLELHTYTWKTMDHPFRDHVFVVENKTEEKMMKYEDGPDYDPENPFAEQYCNRNCSYGVHMTFGPDGTVYFPIVCHRSDKEFHHTTGGVVLMRRDPSSGEWSPSNQRYIDPSLSWRGLLEPDAAVLAGGTILVVCRGSNNESTGPGRKWRLYSTDGGRTLSEVEELRYDDGSQFYSPSSIHKFIRSSRNGRLYWIANITPDPPTGNEPRYPLHIAEIDEEKMAVKKDSLVMIDDRGEDEPEVLALSNFSVIENRETEDFEIYVTRDGEDPEDRLMMPAYKCVFSPPA